MDLVQALDLNTNIWTNDSAMNEPRFSHCCIGVESQSEVYALAGYSGYDVSQTVEYRDSGGSWTTLSDIFPDDVRLYNSKAIYYDGYIVTVGGYDYGEGLVAEHYLIDVVGKTITKSGALDTAMRHSTPVVCGSSTLYNFGGLVYSLDIDYENRLTTRLAINHTNR